MAKQFKSESKRLLDMMINSIYTHKEIFLRELISNANDAIDKLYYISLADENIEFNRENFYIRISADKEKRLLTITDTGLGMDEKELEENLGTIAKSGSLAFKKSNELGEDIDIIGQFGVGFYSAFMVSDCVTVISRKFGSDKAFMWQSKGADGYDITPAEYDKTGTQITLSIKKNTEDENYDEFLGEFKIKELIKKYSDYIKYPIKMLTTKTRKKEESEEYETYTEDEVLNSMVPLWKKGKNELTDEDYNNFYRERFHDFAPPAKVIHTKTDGVVSYNALMFVPNQPSFDYYTKEFEKGLALYSNGVLIMEKCADLLPDYFGFVKGLVDSADLSLNISREILQHDRQLKAIASNIKKKIKSELESMQKNDRENYEAFYKHFSRQLKFGIYDSFGADKDILKDLIMFISSDEKKYMTLKEYVDSMKEGQEFIYYAAGETADKIEKMPQVEMVLDKGYKILYLTEDVDEFAIKILNSYNEKEFKSVSASDLGLESEEEAKKAEETKEENKEMFELMANVLEGKVSSVKATARLKSHPVCITSEGEVSSSMEKVLSKVPTEGQVKATKILEINMNHKVFETLKALYKEDTEKFKKYTEVLYSASLLIEGMNVSDPVSFANDLCDLIG